MTAWQSGFVDAPGVRVHYTRTGGELPPLVLAHGVTDDGLCWTSLAQQFERDYDVVMVDARGHGLSTAPESGYEPGPMAADLEAVISGLGLDRPAVLGHSMGAITALALAALFPDVPGQILAEDPPPWWMGLPEQMSPEYADIRPRMTAWMTDVKTKTADDLVAAQRLETPWWPDGEYVPWAESKLRFDLRGLALFEKSAVTSVDWATELTRVNCPILLITGDPERGAIVAPPAADRLRALVPTVHVAHVAESGHSIHRDQPAAFLRAVRGFLRNVPA